MEVYVAYSIHGTDTFITANYAATHLKHKPFKGDRLTVTGIEFVASSPRVGSSLRGATKLICDELNEGNSMQQMQPTKDPKKVLAFFIKLESKGWKVDMTKFLNRHKLERPTIVEHTQATTPTPAEPTQEHATTTEGTGSTPPAESNVLDFKQPETAETTQPTNDGVVAEKAPEPEKVVESSTTQTAEKSVPAPKTGNLILGPKQEHIMTFLRSAKSFPIPVETVFAEINKDPNFRINDIKNLRSSLGGLKEKSLITTSSRPGKPETTIYYIDSVVA